MKTEVVMKRPLFGYEISQKSKSEFLSSTDLVKAGNVWRIKNGLAPFDLIEWFRQKGTKEFINELENKFGKVKISGKGRGHHTWVHPLLFIDIALAISPKLKIETYEWLYDNLLKNRNESGDSFKKMAGTLWVNCNNKSLFQDIIKDTCYKIRLECGIDDWQKADENQLKLRDKMHNNISLLGNVLRNNDEAIRLGIIEAKKFS
jgi:hypothetical protein